MTQQVHRFASPVRSLSPLWLLLFSWVGCGGAKEAPSLHLTGHAPSGEVHDARPTIRLTFDAPAVAADQVGKTLAAPPVSVSPEVATTAHWLDRQTLLVKPVADLARATRYTVALSGDLATRVGDDARFDFVHAPLAVQGVTGVLPDWLERAATFTLVLNQPVRAGHAAERCRLVGQDGEKRDVALTTPDASLVAARIPLAAKETLALGSAWELRCSEIVAEGGNAPLDKPFTRPLRVHPALAVQGVAPTEGARVTPDELTLALTFSTPVPEEELARHVHLEPKNRSFRGAWVQRESTKYEMQVNLEAETRYTLRVDKQLKDQFGQVLGKGHAVTFQTTDASPALSVETGIYAIEAEGGGYPVWSRNVESFELACANVPEKRLVSLLANGLDLSPWMDKASTPLDFAKLGLRAKRTNVHPGSAKNKWTKGRVDFGRDCGGAKRGIFLAELGAPPLEAKVRERGGGMYPYRVLGNVTDLGVLLKVAPASGLVWVASLSSAAPVAQAQINLYDLRGKKVWSGQTDERGLAELPGADRLLTASASADEDPYAARESWHETYRDQRMIAVVRKGDDVAVVDGAWNDGIQAWNFGLDTDHAGGELRVRGFLESDRGIYRPGETVHLKGLAREVPRQGPARVPTAREVAVHVEDVQGAAVFDGKLPLSPFGGFAFDVPLDAGAPTGDYFVTASLAGQTFRESFSVEEVRPVTFEITDRGAPTSVRLGDKVKVPLEARYLFGAPVSKSKVSFEVQRRPHWVTFPEFEAYSFTDYSELSDWSPWWEPDSYSEFVSEGEATTDAAGRFSVVFRDPAKEVKSAQDYLVRVTVRDAADQEVTKRLAITAHPSDFYLGVRADSWVQTAGAPFSAQMVAVDRDGKQVATQATLSLSRERWVCSHESGPYGYYSPCERHLDAVWSRPVGLNGAAPSAESITAEQPGEYTLRLVAKDARGVQVSTATSIWVVGEGDTFWGDERSATLPLIASKKRYVPGETAKIVPQADLRGAAVLVTLERNGVLAARLEGAEVATRGVEVPIEAAHAPNVYVSVAMIRPRRGPTDDERPALRLGIVNLPVAFEAQRLKVSVTTERSDFEPGQTVQGRVRVTGQDGAPVRAEVALSAADEGILQLIDYHTPDPLDAFYRSWGLGVDNASNWTRVARLNNAPVDADGEEGADSAGGEDRVRSRFVASAYWAPALVTDERGEATFSFTAPDNLTAFRLMAAAADDGARFGAGEQRIRVRKDLLLAPIVPRFLLENDEIELGAVVHNYTAGRGDVQVQFEFAGVSPAKSTVKVTVEPNGKATARVKAKVLDRQQAVLKMTAALGGARDALEQTLPILHPSVTDYVTALSGRGANARTEHLTWPSEVDLDQSALEVLVDRVGLADLGPSLKYLVRYPYGCLEQTMSGLVPLLKVRDLAESLDLSELTGPRLDTYVRLGVAKVVRHQQGDGHFSLWPGSATYPHLTVYALWGLNEARRAGVKVPQNAIDLGLGAARAWANDGSRPFSPSDETATVAMAAFVLADFGQPDTGLIGRLYEARGALPAYGKAFLLRAMLRAKSPKADVATLARELSSHIERKDGAARVVEPIKLDAHYFSTEVRSTAMVLSALIDLGGQDDTVAALVRGLRAHRTGSRWESTQDNVYSLVALADYARVQAHGKATVEVRAGERSLASRTLSGGAAVRLRVPLRELTRGVPLTVTASEPVYYTAVLEQLRPEPVASALDRGFAITREYLDHDTEQPLAGVRVGDLVRVRLRLRTERAMDYVAISDPFPSGFEAVNGRLATERGSDAEPYWGFWDHRDLRDERVDWFVDSLGAGEHTLEYVLRATHAGAFVVPPTRAEEMYTPSVMGHGASQTLEVRR